jgi:hypothetical protein
LPIVDWQSSINNHRSTIRFPLPRSIEFPYNDGLFNGNVNEFAKPQAASTDP